MVLYPPSFYRKRITETKASQTVKEDRRKLGIRLKANSKLSQNPSKGKTLPKK